MTRLRRMFQRTALDTMEVSMMRGILAAVQRKAVLANESEADSAANPQVDDKTDSK